MDNNDLTPERSLELITQVITQARSRFQENGFIYMFWGALVAIATISQFFMLKSGLYNTSWYPYMLMPLGGIFSFIYFYRRKSDRGGNQINKIVSICWIFLSFNLLILGFVFSHVLKENLMPILLILMSIGTIVSGISIKSSLILFSGIFINFSAFICFTIDWMYQPLLMSVVSVVAILIPGIVLMIKYNKQKENV